VDHRANDLLADISDQLDRISATLNRIEECLMRIELAEADAASGAASEQTQDLSAFIRRIPPGPRSDPTDRQS